MGEVAEMMLDGTLCEQCGTFIGEPVGYPRLCSDCANDDEYDFNLCMNVISAACDEIYKHGTDKQKKALVDKLYSRIRKIKKETK